MSHVTIHTDGPLTGLEVHCACDGEFVVDFAAALKAYIAEAAPTDVDLVSILERFVEMDRLVRKLGWVAAQTHVLRLGLIRGRRTWTARNRQNLARAALA